MYVYLKLLCGGWTSIFQKHSANKQPTSRTEQAPNWKNPQDRNAVCLFCGGGDFGICVLHLDMFFNQVSFPYTPLLDDFY